jgi:putative transposase
MILHRKTLKRFDTPGHAHFLTFSCYHKKSYLNDSQACRFFLEELAFVREKYRFSLWAYVLMPDHVHLLLWPRQNPYSISDILKDLKARSSRNYSIFLNKHSPEIFASYLVTLRGVKTFLLWQRGGGFDSNVQEGKSVCQIIRYIENNPVTKGFVKEPPNWVWSSAHARKFKTGVIPDECNVLV